MRNHALLAALAVPALLAVPARMGGAAAPAQEEGAQDPSAAFAAALAEGGVLVDFESGSVAIDVDVLIKEDLLEYILVGPGGAAHESLFVTAVTPSLLNAGMLALGAEPGTNATWETIEPQPTLEERRAGKKGYRVFPPKGDGFYMYATWREGDDLYRYRVEDLIANLKTGRAMGRHRMVYLGSAFVPADDEGEPPVFAADVEGNLINVSFFRAGHTLLTAALADCEDQSIWLANPWLTPARGATVRLVFTREPRDAEPAAWADSLPVVAPPAPDSVGEEGSAGEDG